MFASSKRRRRGRSKKSQRSARPVLVLLVMILVAGSATVAWLRSERGEIWLAERGVASAQEHCAQLWQSSLLDGLMDAGIPPDSVVVHPGYPVEVEVGASCDLFALNLAVTRRLEAAGGQVAKGERFEDQGSSVLELWLGGKGYVSHRLLARRGPQASALQPPPPPKGLLAIVVDDFGHNLNATVRQLLSLSVPITVAILPERPASLRVLSEARRAGKEAILHMPMEPVAGSSPGPGKLALMVDMSREEVRRRLERALDELSGVQGLNNHMGSEFTQHPGGMEVVAQVLAERGLYFLDSLTSPHSVAYETVRRSHVPALRNDLFLDLDVQDPALIEQRLQRLIERARRKGTAIGIGHPEPATARVLQEILPQLDPRDVKPVFLSEILRSFPQS